jgi:excinuclease UvrABC nuclease subunit
MEATAKKDLIAKAKEAEEAQEFEQAAEIYEQVLTSYISTCFVL